MNAHHFCYYLGPRPHCSLDNKNHRKLASFFRVITLGFMLSGMLRLLDGLSPAANEAKAAEIPNGLERGQMKEGAHAGYSTSTNGHLLQSPATTATRPPTDYGLGDSHVSKLMPYPAAGPGE